MPKKSNYNFFSDTELISLLITGDHIAFTDIYNRYNKVLIAFAYRKLGDEELAMDIVQDVFTTLWVRREGMPLVNNLGGYLMACAKHSVFSFFAHQQVKSKYVESLRNFVNTGSIAHADYLLREREWEAHIDSAVRSLPAKMRVVFELSRKQHLSNIEIAKKLKTSESNVSKHIHGAVKILKARLGTFFIFF